MATCTMTKPKTGTWAETFPKQQLNEQESLKFVKKLLAIAVSNITYLRVILPEHAFLDRSVEGVNLKILKCEKSCPGVPLLVDWLKGAFDALEKKYLRVLILGIYKNRDDPNTLIEAYTFKFSYADKTAMDIYKNNKKISSTDACNKTKQATVALLRTLIVLMGTLKPLPDNYMVTMKLLYYDKVTPMDYEPPGFKAAESDSFTFEDKPMKIKAGDVSTLFHALKMRVTTVSANFKADIPTEDAEDDQHQQHISLEGLDIEDDEDQEKQQQAAQEKLPLRVEETRQQAAPDNNQQKQPVRNNKSRMSQIEEINHEANSSDAGSKEDHSISQKSTTSYRSRGSLVAAPPMTSTPGQRLSGLSERNALTCGKPVDENREGTDLGVRCCCGNNEDDGLMILCAVCGYWQHGICFMIREIEEASEQHICNLCCNPNEPSLQPTDPTLVGLSGEELQMTCLWRRALMACREEKFVTVNGLSNRLGVGKAVVAKLMQRLEKEEYVKSARGKLSKQAKSVNVDKINKEGIVRYFQKNLSLKQNNVRDTALESTKQVQEEALSKSVKSAQSTAKDIQTIVAGTDNLGLSASSASQSGNVMNSVKTSMPVRSSPRLNAKSMLEEQVSKLGKRLRSATKDVYDFEFSNTQEDYEMNSQPSKRRKASVAARDLEP